MGKEKKFGFLYVSVEQPIVFSSGFGDFLEGLLEFLGGV